MIKKCVILIILLSLLTSCSKSVEEKEVINNTSQSFFLESVEDIYEDYIPMLNTIVKVTLDNPYDEELYNDIYLEFSKYHKLLDSHHYYRDEKDEIVKNIAYINDYYGYEDGLVVDEEMIDILSQVKELFILTKGYFNPFLREMINLYDGKFSSFPIEMEDPDISLINKALDELVDYKDVDEILEIDKENNKVIFHKYKDIEKIGIDLGAFSKGYVSNKLTHFLNSKGISALLDLGTSSISACGKKEYNVGVLSPNNRYKYIFALNIVNEHLSTSNDNNKYYILKDSDIIRSHILNPFKGFSDNYYRSVSIISDNGFISDVLSTALFSIEDTKEIEDIIEGIKQFYLINVDYILVKDDGNNFVLETSLDSNKLLNINLEK